MESEPWPWMSTLAVADPGRWVRIGKTVLGTVSSYCSREGLKEGLVVRYVKDDGEALVLEHQDGRTQTIYVPFAWFIKVEPVAN